ncbi:HAD family hydrolase [Halodesulfovibrio marinisediminis]|uniref:phosphoglycolate phosphatase n=1 Tax=Halodesulfovibrio marinisediminis DSM 17456 TaxID=1121457 RepID=A0A1N6DU44_9BACT|nr:HAD-IA family hydrolase [Halodesulfovibrio marinisediminis]SIN74316.1 haloacid dehalogenase superfamily, subfamily IA, variant 3 with third motif having DD or ED/haloacid dehalogenase superfamily, subfamily IA, variant 1 with third motif having Dx(3-4)D or Dx(3-4)E [Halodesulfovibrio marinisediminis DSM 17456]
MNFTPELLDNMFPDGLGGLIFDCDGVMFDTRACNIGYYNQVLDVLGMPPLTEEQEEVAHYSSVMGFYEAIVPKEKHHLIPEAQKKVNYVKTVLPLMIPESGLYGLLETAVELGLKLAVFTNRSNTMEMVLEQHDMDGFFHPVMTAAKVECKPHPEGALEIMKEWNESADRVVFIGDSIVDEEAAKRAGISFWAYKNTDLRGVHINDFERVKQILIEWCNRSK